MLTFSDTEEKAVEKAIAALADMIPLEAIQPPHSPALVFPGLEIRLHQRRVLKNGIDVSLTRLEYDALCYLAASPGRVFTKAQIFEAVWSMGSESCQSSVTNVICNLRKKIEPDSRNPTYIKTILGIGYKFVSRDNRRYWRRYETGNRGIRFPVFLRPFCLSPALQREKKPPQNWRNPHHASQGKTAKASTEEAATF